jgi:hypothetical protein
VLVAITVTDEISAQATIFQKCAGNKDSRQVKSEDVRTWLRFLNKEHEGERFLVGGDTEKRLHRRPTYTYISHFNLPRHTHIQSSVLSEDQAEVQK